MYYTALLKLKTYKTHYTILGKPVSVKGERKK